MGREKRNLPAAVAGGAKERHRRAQRSQYDPKAPMPEGFVAKPTIPKTKYPSYFEFVQNEDKKKKLEFKITNDKTPPPGYEFIPTGNPLLTKECKELSREKEAMIFIVSNAKELDPTNLAHQVHRIGHHIRERIVEEARARLGQSTEMSAPVLSGAPGPEPIPESQEEYNAQVDATIRDLFPRVPHTDRQMIIEHAFRKGTKFKGEKPVGLSTDITLARRVQLAVLAHIRHNHTRYDRLLKETTWQNARKVVEPLCLDILVKWRGDEETGRDQLDEILREVVVISDSEDDSDDETDDSSVEEIITTPNLPTPIDTTSHANHANQVPIQAEAASHHSAIPARTPHEPMTPIRVRGRIQKPYSKRKGFKRYQAWEDAIRRYRKEQDDPTPAAPARSPSRDQHHGFVSSHTTPFNPSDAHMSPQVRTSPGQPGPAPNENGYVGHPPTQYSRVIEQPSGLNHTLPSRAPVYDMVNSSVHDPRQGVLVRRIESPVSRPLQDLLVPSIESSSQDTMRPSFVRTVPPRVQTYAEHFPGRVQARVTRPMSPSRDIMARDGPICVNRRVVGGHEVSENQYPGNRFDGGPPFPVVPRDQIPLSSLNGPPVPVSLQHHPDTRPYRPNHVSETMSSKRLYVYADPIRVGEHGNPMLMEDRGGFYERVQPLPDHRQPPPRDVDFMETRRPAHESWRGPEAHRVTSWQEGSRMLRDNRGATGVEFIPISGAHTLPMEARSHTVLADAPVLRARTPSRVVYETRVDWDSRPMPHQGPIQEAFPVILPPRRHEAEGYYDEGLAYRDHRDYRGQHDDRPPMDNSRPRRGFPMNPPRPENVIVLE